MLRCAFVAIALLSLAACGSNPDGDTFSSTGSDYSASAATAAGSYRVVAGDTLYAISRKTEVPLRALIETNHLQPPYLLKTGQVLAIPSLPTYTVKSGDTLFSLSRRFSVDMSELARANGIQEPYVIKSGEVLVVPNRTVVAQASGAAAASAPASSVSTSSAPAASSSAAAGSTGVSTAPLAPIVVAPVAAGASTTGPSATAPASLAPPAAGTTAAEATAPAGSTPTAPAPAAPATTDPAAAAPAPAAAAPAQSTPTSSTPASTAPTPTVLPDPPARAGSKFIWPVDGTLLSTFGPKDGGLHNDGINIAAPKGAPIKAADNGVVAYVGDGLRGFGNLILIKHQGDYVTAYAHADQILVKRGQVVRRGETIGRVGSTGAVDTPQLHFEIRKGSRAIDPLTVMTSQTASKG